MQHELEMKQREEQQEMFTRIDQSRLAIPLDQSAVSQSQVAEERKNTKALPRRDVGPIDVEEGIITFTCKNNLVSDRDFASTFILWICFCKYRTCHQFIISVDAVLRS